MSEISAQRLLLRPYTLNDAKAIHELILVSSQSGEEVMAEEKIADWIRKHHEQCEKGERLVFAITLKKSKELIGSIDLTMDKEDHARAALGYWIGAPFRNQGFCTEAGHAVLEYGFAELNLQTIYADYYSWNHASAKVIQKLGMSYETTYKKYEEKWDVFMDVDRYVIVSTIDKD